MYVIKVAPIAKIPLPSPQILTYFSSQKLQEGSLILVPLQKRKVFALVLSQKKAEEIKAEIKRAEFKLKPILRVIEERTVLASYQIKLAHWISNYYWAPLGKAISLFLPTFFLGELAKGKIKEKSLFPSNQQLNKIAKKYSSKLYITPFGFLPKEIIENTVKNGKQVLFLIPEKSQGNFWIRKIQQTTDNLKLKTNNICFFSTDLPFRKYIESFKKIRDGKSKITIGTRSALFAPFSNLGLILIVEPENKNYKSEMEPRYNAKNIGEKLAEILGINLILVSSLPSIENYVESDKVVAKREEEVQEIKKEIIDMKKGSKMLNKDIFYEWSSLSQPLFEEIKKNLLLKRKVILFINRRGEGLSVVCQDCGWIKKCKNCDAPLILYKKSDKNLSMVCYHCGSISLPPKQCAKCQSWKLVTLGSGIEKIERELKEKFKNSKILRLDSKVAARSTTQKMVLKSFFEKNGDILLTTSILFRYLPILVGKKVPLVGIISIDSLLSLPDFRAEEEGVKIVHNLLSFTLDKFIFQTFWPNSQVANFIKNGYNSFLKELLKERERFFYPPFSKIIKLTFSHKDSQKAENESLNLKKKLEGEVKNKSLQIQILGPSPSFIQKIRGKYIWTTVIKLKKLKANEKKQILSIVPSYWKVDVDPLTII